MVHAGVTIGFDEIVRRHGGDPARVIESSGLQHRIQPVMQTSEITLSAFSSLLRAAAAETKRPTFSIEFAEAFDPRSFGAIGYLFELAPDMGTALKDFCAAFELLQENTEIGVETHGDLARITYSVRSGTPEEKSPDAEFSVTMLGAAIRGGGSISDVCRIDLEHQPNWERDAVPAWLGTDFRPNSTRNAIYVKRNSLDRPGRFKDAYLYGIFAERVFDDLRHMGSRNDIVSMVVELLKHAGSSGDFEKVTAPYVARQLGISARTLHRQLAAHGAKFRELKNSVLLDSARLLLSDNRYSVTEAAFVLGFSETSAFSRAFRELSGLSPAQFKKNQTRCCK
ncbi:AraC family transcriptional regulator [Rhizobium sp. L1K21]|uniref:AraC family transcriptional regulator n=1 Tax=Rhizobium sp. L1K21 TaxID=2954933 RepID=UPI002093BFC5|nr:AraC family transcriptional regulator [Rhizobium sp. L1K21]MCO6185159.1 AraC family transcriptional regulator [Rhizobium sp. L1K21]